MTPCGCHQNKPFRDDWASLLTAEEKQLIETGAFVCTVPLVGNDPQFVRNIMNEARRLDDPECQQRRAEAEARRAERCNRCLCKECRARHKGDCEKKCDICGGIRELSRCGFREEYYARRKVGCGS